MLPAPCIHDILVVDTGMARRGSEMTIASLRLTDDAVDPGSGLARLAPIQARPASDDANIAPWVDIPVSIETLAVEAVEGLLSNGALCWTCFLDLADMVFLAADAPSKDTKSNILPTQGLGCVVRAA